MNRAAHPTSALRWIAHPVTVAAAVVLFVNDHALKQAWPGLVTGKLSDVAGMVMFPALLGALAGLVRVPLRVSRWAAPVVTVIGFAWVKATVAGAAAASAVWSGVILRDPTDLVALPGVVLSWWVAGRVSPEPVPLARRVRLFAALGFALVATAATSAPNLSDAALLVDEGPDGIRVTGTFGNAVSADLEHWTYSRPPNSQRDFASADLMLTAGTPDGCDPADPRHCYRVRDRLPEWHGGREVPRGGALLGVEETTDGGATWTMAWEIPPERWEFLADRHGLFTGRDEPLMVSTDLLVRAMPGGGHQVIVANGVEGLAVRDVDGSWRRVPIEVPGPNGLAIRPLAITDFGAATALPGTVGINLALVAALIGGVVMATRVWTRRRGSGVVVWPIVLIPALWICGGYGWMREGGATLALALVLPIGGFLGVWFQKILPRRRALAIYGTALLVAVLYTLPFYGWSVGVPGLKADAQRIGLIAAGLAAVAHIAVSWWAAGKPLPRRPVPQRFFAQRWVAPVPPVTPVPPKPRRPGQW